MITVYNGKNKPQDLEGGYRVNPKSSPLQGMDAAAASLCVLEKKFLRSAVFRRCKICLESTRFRELQAALKQKNYHNLSKNETN